MGGRAHALTLDVTDIDAIGPAVQNIEVSLGPIDILVNNDGLSVDGRALDVDAAAYDTVLGVNTRAPFFMAQAVARAMVADGRAGSVINIASLVSIKPVNNLSTYAMSKAALDHMTRALSPTAYSLDTSALRSTPSFSTRRRGLNSLRACPTTARPAVRSRWPAVVAAGK
eukprot:7390392-Prymnesium_polylepis.1